MVTDSIGWLIVFWLFTISQHCHLNKRNLPDNLLTIVSEKSNIIRRRASRIEKRISFEDAVYTFHFIELVSFHLD